MPAFICMENFLIPPCYIGKYKDMSLEQDNKCGASSLLHCTKNGMKNGTGCSKKLDIDADFFCHGSIHNVNMNQSLFFFPLLTSGYGLFGRLLFRIARTQETQAFLK